VDWVECKSVWVLRPDFAEVFVGRQSVKSLESSGEVVCGEEVGQVRFELIMGVVEEALDGGFLDSSVHAFALAVGPGMIGFGKSMLDTVPPTYAVEWMAPETGGGSLTVPGTVGELDAVVGEHGMDAIRNGFDERFEEGSGSSHVGLFDEFYHGELRGPVDGHEQIELALGRSYFSQVDMKEADRIAVELLPSGPVPFDLWQTADAMPFEAAVQ